MRWDGSDRRLRQVVFDDLYGLGRPNDLDGSSGPNNPEGFSRVSLKDTSFIKFNLNFFYKK